MSMKYAPLLGLTVALTGCTWVELQEGAEAVALVESEQIEGCQPLSRTHAQVADRIGPFRRNEEKMAEELTTLAKNEAVHTGGDTLVATSDIEQGRQRFRIYQCEE